MPSTNTNDHESLFESFMESLIPQLPNEIRRNLDHIRALDLICTNDLIKMQRLQKEFIAQSEYKIMKLHVCPIRTRTPHGGYPQNELKENEDCKENDNNYDDNSSKKRSYDEIVESNSRCKQKRCEAKTYSGELVDDIVELGIKVPTLVDGRKGSYNCLDRNDSDTDDDNTGFSINPNNEARNNQVDDEAVVPTTDELMDYILMDDRTGNDDSEDEVDDDGPRSGNGSDKPTTRRNENSPPRKALGSTKSTAFSLYQEIVQLQTNCIQKSDEKVMVAKQTYQLLKSHLERLEIDLTTMDKILQTILGELGDTKGGVAPAMPNDLAACQVTPGSEWILAKVISYDQGMYTLSDEDVESDKIFNLPESQVIILPGNARFGLDYHKVAKGDVVFAIYPDTTSFYKATVVSVPRKQASSSSSNIAAATAAALNQVAMVNFVDDSDEFGITHDKAVPMKYIMPPPPS